MGGWVGWLEELGLKLTSAKVWVEVEAELGNIIFNYCTFFTCCYSFEAQTNVNMGRKNSVTHHCNIIHKLKHQLCLYTQRRSYA